MQFDSVIFRLFVDDAEKGIDQSRLEDPGVYLLHQKKLPATAGQISLLGVHRGPERQSRC